MLTEKYRALDGYLWKFYLNRYSRLIPTYLAVIALIFWFMGSPFNGLDAATWQNLAFKFSALTLFGIELTAFYQISSNVAYDAHGHLPVPQAWSLGVELWFYLLAPAITLLSRRALLSLAVSVLCARILILWAGADGFPWLQRLWPLELYFFLLGVISHRVYEASELKRQAERHRAAAVLAYVAVVVIVAFAGYFSGMEAWKEHNAFLVTIGLAACLPFIFSLTRQSGVDRWVGEFSYPLYLVHLLVLNVVPAVRTNVWIFFAVSLLACVPLIALIEIPVDRWRQRFFKTPSPGLALRGVKEVT